MTQLTGDGRPCGSATRFAYRRLPSGLPKAIYPRDLCELILVQLVLDGVLREDFGHTMYTTVSYLYVGSR